VQRRADDERRRALAGVNTLSNVRTDLSGVGGGDTRSTRRVLLGQ